MESLSECLGKRLLILYLLISCAWVLNATNVEKLIFVVSGKPVSIEMSTQPIVTYANDTLHIETILNTFDIIIRDINYIYLNNETSTSVTQQPTISINNGKVQLRQLPLGSQVSLFTIDGTKLDDSFADSNGIAIVNIGCLAKGVYIVKSATQSIKCVIK